MYSIVCVSLSYDTRNVFSLFSVKYMGLCPLNRKRTVRLDLDPVRILEFESGSNDLCLKVINMRIFQSVSQKDLCTVL